MNIHFKNTELLQTLQKATLVEIEVGSALYGVKNTDVKNEVSLRA
jgi:hypothetical protein